MGKWIHKIGLMLVVVLIAGNLTACGVGSTIETKLNINDDLSGNRVMELVIDQSVFNEYFAGTKEDLGKIIAENCPSELVWECDETTDNMIYNFTLDFSTPEEYQKKVLSILGVDAEKTVTLYKGDSVWANGVYVEENFRSTDLLEWLKKAIVNASFVSASNSSNIFQDGNNIVIFAGEEYNSPANIFIDKIEYLDITSIDIFTDVSQYDAYTKTIELSIPEGTMMKKGEEVKKWLKNMLPVGAQGTWEQKGSDSVYKVTKTDMSAEEMATFLQEYFGSEDCTVLQTEIEEGMSPFSFNISLNETIDFQSFIVGEGLFNTKVNYFVKGQSGYMGGARLEELPYLAESGTVIEEHPGYQHITEEYGDGIVRNYSSFYQKIFWLSEVAIHSSIGILGNMEREIVFGFSEEPEEEYKTKILDKINNLEIGYDEIGTEQEIRVEEHVEENEINTEENEKEEVKHRWNVEVNDEIRDNIYKVTVKQKGNREEIRKSSAALFGYEGDMFMAEKYAFWKWKYAIAFYDNFNLGNFVDFIDEDASVTYDAITGLGSDISYCNIEDAKIDGNRISLSENRKTDWNEISLDKDITSGVDIICYGRKLNLWACAFYLFITIFVVSLLLLLKKIEVLEKVAVFVKGRKNKQKTETPNLTKTVQDDEPLFCTKCGAKRDADALVCTQCGTRFED